MRQQPGEVWFCPEHPNVKEFTISAREFHTWVVDERGDFIRDVDCYGADVDDSTAWCTECGEEARFGTPPTVLDQIAKAVTESEP